MFPRYVCVFVCFPHRWKHPCENPCANAQKFGGMMLHGLFLEVSNLKKTVVLLFFFAIAGRTCCPVKLVWTLCFQLVGMCFHVLENMKLKKMQHTKRWEKEFNRNLNPAMLFQHHGHAQQVPFKNTNSSRGSVALHTNLFDFPQKGLLVPRVEHRLVQPPLLDLHSLVKNVVMFWSKTKHHFPFFPKIHR